MEELSPELGVTDPVSGNIVSKVGFMICSLPKLLTILKDNLLMGTHFLA